MINLMGVLALIASGLITTMVFEALPSITDDGRLLVAAAVTCATSLLFESAGMPPRVFYVVPLWLAALIVVGVDAYERYGLRGIAALLVGAVILVGFMREVGALHESRRERKAIAQRLAETDLNGLNPDFDQAWDAVHEAIIIPRVTPWTGELLAHQHRVATLVERWIGDRIPEPRLLKRAVLAFGAGAADPTNADADQLRQESAWLQSVIRNRDALARKAAALRQLQAQSP